jgi:hypothetical protein
MNKEYALDIISMIERHTLEKTSSLAREAASYLMNLIFRKKNRTQEDNELYEKCYTIKYNSKF